MHQNVNHKEGLVSPIAARLKKTGLVGFCGLLGSIISTGSFLPQVLKVWLARPEPAQSVSFPMYALLGTGCICWIIYGIGRNSKPVWISNVIVVCFAILIVIYKLIYG